MIDLKKQRALHSIQHATCPRIRIKKLAQPDPSTRRESKLQWAMQCKKMSEHRGTPKYRGAAHPLCFTDEVLDHEFPAGFKPVNIEAYDGTTDPGVWIEDYILHIHMARGDDLHVIKYLPLKLKGLAGIVLKAFPKTP